MSKTVDQRVVEMRFDNKEFERNVSTTMSSVEKLKKSLNFDGASKGLDNISAAAKNCDIGAVGRAAETVGLKFSAMYTMADQALRNITNAALNAGKRIVSALTIDPIKAGFSEYETKINAIQTIKSNTASKGTTMDDITKTLNELNTYADKTIYNFAEMTRNIGTFTAAGVGLEDSAKAIQGIANLAAASGSSSQQASTAMYQLSQALSTGTVRLMDWNSVVNAGMGGEKFQEALKATAREHGVAVDDIIKKNGSFRDSLSDGWLSADILNETLHKFTVKGAKEYAQSMLDSGKYTQAQADALIKEAQAMEDAATKVKTFTQLWSTLKESAQSGWAQTWEIIIGNFDEAQDFLTKVSDVIGGVIGKSAEARNELLENWKVLGGRKDLLDSIENIFEAISNLVKPIAKAFREIFPKATAEQLKAITGGLKEFTEKLIMGEETSEKVRRTFRGLFAVIKLVVTIVTSAIKAASNALGIIDPLGGGILSITANLGDFLFNLCETIEQGKVFEKIFGAIGKVIKFAVGIVKAFAGVIDYAFYSPTLISFSGLIETIINKFSELGSEFENISGIMKDSALFKVFKSLWDIIKSIARIVGDTLTTTFENLSEKIANADLAGLIEIINGVITGGIGVGIGKLIFNIAKLIGNASDLSDSICTVLDRVSGALKAFQNKLNAEALKTLAIAIAILAGSILVLAFIPQDKLINATAAIAAMFGTLMIAMKVLGSMQMNSSFSFKKGSGIQVLTSGVSGMAKEMIKLSIAVLILAAACKQLSGLDGEELAKGLIGVTVLLAALFGVMVGMKKLMKNGIASKEMTIAVKGLIPMVVSVYILATVCKKLGKLEWEEMFRGLTGVVILLGALFGITLGLKNLLKNGSNSKDIVKATTMMIVMASALLMMSRSVILLSVLKWEALARGLVGVLSVLTILVGATVILSFVANKEKTLVKGAAAMAIMSACIMMLVPSFMLLSAMKWESIGRGVVGLVGVLGVIVGAVTLLSLIAKKEKTLAKGAASMAIMSACIVMLVPSFMILSAMKWPAILRGVVSLVGVLGALVGAMAIMSLLKGSSVLSAASIAIVSGCIILLVKPFKILSELKWEAIAKGATALVTVLGLIVGATALMSLLGPMGLVGAVSIAAIAASLMVLAPAMVMFGSMDLASIGRGLIAVAGSITVLGIASAALSSVSPTVIMIASAIALMGVGAIAAAASLTLFAEGITLLGPAIVLFAKSIVTAMDIVGNATAGVTKLVAAIVVGFVQGITQAIPQIQQALFELVLGLLGNITEYIPQIVDTILGFLLEVVRALGAHAPELVSAIYDLVYNMLVSILGKVAEKLPEVIKAVTDVFMALITGVIEAIGSMDTSVLKTNFKNMGFLVGLMAELAAMAVLAPIARIGVIQMAGVIAQLAIVLAAFGALAQIPGLTWIIGEGGTLLEAVGSSIGKFAGGIVGGLANGISSALPEIGSNLSEFMSNAETFIDGASTIDSSVVDGVMSLVKVMLAITGAEVLNSLSSFATGGSSIAKFSAQLPILGLGLLGFSVACAGINVENVKAGTDAAKELAEMANTIPNQGGIAAWFAGDNSVAKFGAQLPILGAGLLGFSLACSGINPENVKAGTAGAKALAEMANVIPNQGGIVAWFTGDNSVAQFGAQLPILGTGLLGFSLACAGMNVENVKTGTNAAKVLAEMADTIPNHGGVVAWFAGDNSIASFGAQLPILGMGLSMFSMSMVGMNVENVKAGANAAKVLAEMSNSIPNQGGIVAWFSGDNGVARFGAQLPILGMGLKAFSVSVTGIIPENITAAANAAKSLAEMAKIIPNQGGIVAWFAGDNGVAKFGAQLPILGAGLLGFSMSMIGMNIESVKAGASAAKSLAEMTSVIPNQGGIVSWFAGDNSVAKFGAQLPILGAGLLGFSMSMIGINVESVKAGASAAKSLAEMAKVIPNQGGIVAWFAGENSVARFSTQLPILGMGLKGFSTAVTGIVPENVTSAANAAKALAEMVAVVPKEGGIKAWFTGETSVSKFAGELPSLGDGLKKFSDSVVGINPQNVTAAAQAAKSLGEMTNTIPKNTDKIVGFGTDLVKFGDKMKTYFANTAGITSESIANSKKAIETVKDTTKLNADNIKSASKALDELVKSLKNLAKVPSDCTSNFKKALKDLGNKCAEEFINPFEKTDDDMKKAGKKAIDSFVDGAEGKKSTAKSAFEKLAEACASVMTESKKTFTSAGASLVDGFASGISSNSYKAEAKARAMAKAAAKAAEDELDINSPSKVLMKTGYSVPEGFALGIDKMSRVVKSSAVSMADVAVDNVSSSIARLSGMVNNDIDVQPTIRPVLDLSNVKAGAGAINSMLSSGASLDVLANVGSINTLMNRRNQNGANDDVVSELEKLRKDVGNMSGDTYHINGVTYDDGSNISDAVKSIVRAAKIERRT